jgi:hypothetical protein
MPRSRADDTPHVDAVRRMAAAGSSLSQMAQAVGVRTSAIHRILDRYGIELINAPSVRSMPVLILIPPVRRAGRGIVGSGGFDIEDTEEL